MAAGGRINDSYNKYKYKGNLFITITNDSYSKLFNAFKSASEAPEFPIIGSDGGSKPLTTELNASNTVGTTYLIQPDGTYEGAYKGGSDYGVGYYLDKAKPWVESSYKLTVNKGSGSGDYDEGDEVSVTADAPETGYKFEKWIGDTQYVASTSSKATTVTMPAKNISITATYVDTTTIVFNLTVKKGSGSGNYAEDEEVSVVASDPEEGFKFEKWIGDTQYVANTGNASTTVTMPGKNITIEATFVDTSGSDIDTTNPISIMHFAGWEGSIDTVGSTIAVDTSKLKSDTLISAEMSKAKSNDSKKEWAWVKLSAYLDNALSGVTAVKVTYKADDDISLVLDQENLKNAGTSYMKTLVKSDGNFKTVLIGKDDFDQPLWFKGDDALELDKVKSISFEAIKEDASVKVAIKELILYNYVGESILITESNSVNSLALVEKQGIASLVVPKAGTYTITRIGVNGRVLDVANLSLKAGINRLPFLSDKATALGLITVEGAGEKACFKSLLQ